MTDERQQAQYIKLFKDNNMDAVILNSTIDAPFMSHIEMRESDIKFYRIDADLSENLKKDEDNKGDEKAKDFAQKLEKIFKDNLNKPDLKVQVESLKSENISAMILLSEETRRLEEMSKMFGGLEMPGLFTKEQTLVLNKNNQLIQMIYDKSEDENEKELLNILCNQIYDLALLSHQTLEAEAMTQFIERTNKIMAILAERN